MNNIGFFPFNSGGSDNGYTVPIYTNTGKHTYFDIYSSANNSDGNVLVRGINAITANFSVPVGIGLNVSKGYTKHIKLRVFDGLTWTEYPTVRSEITTFPNKSFMDGVYLPIGVSLTFPVANNGLTKIFRWIVDPAYVLFTHFPRQTSSFEYLKLVNLRSLNVTATNNTASFIGIGLSNIQESLKNKNVVNIALANTVTTYNLDISSLESNRGLIGLVINNYFGSGVGDLSKIFLSNSHTISVVSFFRFYNLTNAPLDLSPFQNLSSFDYADCVPYIGLGFPSSSSVLPNFNNTYGIRGTDAVGNILPDFSFCPNITSILMERCITTNGTYSGGLNKMTRIRFFRVGNNMNVASVNQILIDFQTSLAIRTITLSCSVTLNASGNAAPTGAGITAKNALISAGWTVSTN